jgi:hypothetical protein
MRRLLLLPYTFVLLNWAAVRALFCFLRGDALHGLWTGEPRGQQERAALRAAKS